MHRVMEIEAEEALGIWGVVVSIGAVGALVAVLLLFPVIDRWIRPRWDLSRGAAMIVLLVMSLLVGIVVGAVSYASLHDHPDFQDDPSPDPPVQVEDP